MNVVLLSSIRFQRTPMDIHSERAVGSLAAMAPARRLEGTPRRASGTILRKPGPAIRFHRRNRPDLGIQPAFLLRCGECGWYPLCESGWYGEPDVQRHPVAIARLHRSSRRRKHGILSDQLLRLGHVVRRASPVGLES